MILPWEHGFFSRALTVMQARGGKRWDGNTAMALSWGSPKDFCSCCTSSGSSQPTHRNHQPGWSRCRKTWGLLRWFQWITSSNAEKKVNWGSPQDVYRINEELKVHDWFLSLLKEDSKNDPNNKQAPLLPSNTETVKPTLHKSFSRF